MRSEEMVVRFLCGAGVLELMVMATALLVLGGGRLVLRSGAAQFT